MIRHFLCFCLTLPLVLMYSIDVKKDMTVFRKCAQEEQCETPLAVFEPHGSLLCFDKCLKFASCSHVRFNSKTLVCRICKASHVVQSGKPKDSGGDEDWSCRKKPSSFSCSECQPGSTCVKTRSGETKWVHYDKEEHLQKGNRMSMKPRKIFNITEQDLKENWITTKILRPDKIVSLTLSPSFANEFYGLSKKDSYNFNVALFVLKGDSMEKQVRWDNVLLPRTGTLNEWRTIDTGLCLTNDRMSCIYVFRRRKGINELLLHLRSYREIKSPRHLELEREADITNNLPNTMVTYAFACNGKLGMAVYFHKAFSKVVQKYLILTGDGAFTVTESGHFNSQMSVEHVKWNNDGSYAFALSSYYMCLIRSFDGKEQVVTKLRLTWSGECAPVWTNTSLLVYETGWRTNLLHILKL